MSGDFIRWTVAVISLLLATAILWSFINRRWIRLRLLGLIALAYFAAPALALVAHQYGITVGIPSPDVWGLCALGIVLVCISLLEWQASRHEQECRLNDPVEHVFQLTELILYEHLRDGAPIEKLAMEHNVPERALVKIEILIQQLLMVRPRSD